MRKHVLYDCKDKTTASQLLLQLENDPNVIYAYVTADVGNENLISIRQKRKGKGTTALSANDKFLKGYENMGSFAKRGR